jgi:hypothetical protein
MMTWRALFVACAVASGGCDYVFRVDHISLRDDAASHDFDGPIDMDGAVDDGPVALIDAPTACASPIFYEPFTAGTACPNFGVPYMTNADMTQANGVLSIMPKNESGPEPVGGCSTFSNNVAWGSGLTAIVNASVAGNGSYTNLLARGANAQIQVENGELRFENQSTGGAIGAVVPYLPSSMRWWRLSNVNNTAIRAEFSADGALWTKLGGDYTVSVPATIGIEITAGTITIGDVGTTVFDQVMICP